MSDKIRVQTTSAPSAPMPEKAMATWTGQAEGRGAWSVERGALGTGEGIIEVPSLTLHGPRSTLHVCRVDRAKANNATVPFVRAAT